MMIGIVVLIALGVFRLLVSEAVGPVETDKSRNLQTDYQPTFARVPCSGFIFGPYSSSIFLAKSPRWNSCKCVYCACTRVRILASWDLRLRALATARN